MAKIALVDTGSLYRACKVQLNNRVISYRKLKEAYNCSDYIAYVSIYTEKAHAFADYLESYGYTVEADVDRRHGWPVEITMDAIFHLEEGGSVLLFTENEQFRPLEEHYGNSLRIIGLSQIPFKCYTTQKGLTNGRSRSDQRITV